MDISTVKKPPIEPAQQLKPTESARNAQNQESKSKPQEAKRVEEAKPPPVVNTQGHITGQRLNVTA